VGGTVLLLVLKTVSHLCEINHIDLMDLHQNKFHCKHHSRSSHNTGACEMGEFDLIPSFKKALPQMCDCVS